MQPARPRATRPAALPRRIRACHAATTALLCGALACAAAAPAMASTYSITDLGNLGFQYTQVRAINNNGQVTGTSATKQTVEGGCSLKFRPCPTHVHHAFRWEAGTMTDLGTLGGNYSEGNAINNLGEVVGGSQTKSGGEAFLFRNRKMIGIGPFTASAINDLGVIAGGEGIPGNGQTHAIIWQNGKITDLGLLPGEGGIDTAAAGINRSDEVTGSGDNSESMMRAWVWRNGTMTDIGTLGGPQAAAYAINNPGQIVGFAQTSTDADHGYVFVGGKMTDLGLNVFPYAINNNGVIVGSGGCGAAIIIKGGVCQNLQNLIPAGSGYTLQEAKGINDNGQIIAYAQLETDPSHPVHGVLLTPQ